MGDFAISWKIKSLSWMVAAIVVYLNCHLVFDFLSSFLDSTNQILLKGIVILLVLFFVGLLVYITIYPWIANQRKRNDIDFHGDAVELCKHSLGQLLWFPSD
jgi:manganese transport protein